MLKESASIFQEFSKVSNTWKSIISAFVISSIVISTYFAIPHRDKTEIENMSLLVENLKKINELPEEIRPDSKIIKEKIEKIVSLHLDEKSVKTLELGEYVNLIFSSKYTWSTIPYLILMVLFLLLGSEDKASIIGGIILLLTIQLTITYWIPYFSKSYWTVILSNILLIIFIPAAMLRNR